MTTTENSRNPLEHLSFSQNGNKRVPSVMELLQHLIDSEKVSMEEILSSYQSLVNETDASNPPTSSSPVVTTSESDLTNPLQTASSSLPTNNTTGTPFNNPEHTFCFIVGCNEEWEGKERENFGDRAFARKLTSQADVPASQCEYLEDSHATADECQRRLVRMLERTSAGDTLIFYYGGHGHWKGLNTRTRQWKHGDLIDMVERYFCGNTVLLLLDCCNSGNLANAFKDRQLRCDYICLTTAPPYHEAGPNWSMTASLVDALDGSPKIPRGQRDVTLNDLIGYMSDKHALEKGDLLCSFTGGQRVDPATPFFTSGARNHPDCRFAPRLSVGRDFPIFSRVSTPPEMGATVVYRHEGGTVDTLQGGSLFIYPGWFKGRVEENKDNGSCRIVARHPIYPNLTWEVTVSPADLVHDLHMGSFYDISEEFMESQVELAKQFKYLDFSVFPAGAKVRALWWDDILHPGQVLHWMEVDWGDFLEYDAGRYYPAAGPHVPVRWVLEGEGSWDMVPVSRVVAVPENRDSQDFAQVAENIRAASKEALSRAAEEFISERQVLLRSMESMGKKIVDAKKVLGAAKLKYFLPTLDRAWNECHVVCTEDVDLLELARHANYDVSGDYCAVHCPTFWCQNYTTTLLPVGYLSRRDDESAES